MRASQLKVFGIVTTAAKKRDDMVYCVSSPNIATTLWIQSVIGTASILRFKHSLYLGMRNRTGRTKLTSSSVVPCNNNSVAVVSFPFPAYAISALSVLFDCIVFCVPFSLALFEFLQIVFYPFLAPIVYLIGVPVIFSSLFFFSRLRICLSIRLSRCAYLLFMFLIKVPSKLQSAFFAMRMITVKCGLVFMERLKRFLLVTTGTLLVSGRSMGTPNRRLKHITSNYINRPTGALAKPIPVRATVLPGFGVTIANNYAASINAAYQIIDLLGNWSRIVFIHFATSISVLARRAVGVIAPGALCFVTPNFTPFNDRTQILWRDG